VNKSNLFIRVIFLVLILLLSLQIVSAEAKYTREKSEALFHLINWYNYTPSTFETALEKQKPIYLVISAPSWCYWCHVYESRDYLFHEKVYPYINEHFIPIFVDSDKRPDLTRKYLEGGWPSTTIFAPNMERITGFTGPRDPIGLREYFEQLTSYLEDKSFTQFAVDYNYKETSPLLPTPSQLSQIESNFLSFAKQIYDPYYGGFGPGDVPEWRKSQKFPRGLTLNFLLEQSTNDASLLDMVQKTFDNQYTDINELESRYRLYDPVEGGFHRYSTERDWSVPHYEKMLQDQAKLIMAYAHLNQIVNHSNVSIALNGSIAYVINSFYDLDGGFYSSQDAYLEDAYYGLTMEERAKIDPPYIDKTRRIDSNAMMIDTFLYLIDLGYDYEEITVNSLNFIQEMIGDEGASYYYDYDKNKPFLTGQTIANSWALLAFIDAYDSLGNNTYLETAQQIADYSLNNLYDWNSGGFFERNSKDTEFYAPNERIDLSKPYKENAVFSYAMIKLYLATEKTEYLESGIKTFAYVLTQQGGFDETYYVVKSAQLVKENNLLDVYSLAETDDFVTKYKEEFFVNKLFHESEQSVSLDDAPRFRDEFANVGFLILAILAFAAGVLSFLSPCTLPVLSAYFAQNFSANKGEMLRNTLAFFLGLAIVFSIFGMGATFLGSLFREHRFIFTHVAGGLIILMGVLQLLGRGFSGMQVKIHGSKTPIGSFLFGAVFAVGWSACIGPILASLLLLSASTGTILKGSSLLFIYAIGLLYPYSFFQSSMIALICLKAS